MERRDWKSHIGIFAGKTLAASAIFFIIALAAIALSVFIDFAKGHGVSGFMILIFTVLDYAILVIDSLLFLVYLVFGAWKFMKEIYQ